MAALDRNIFTVMMLLYSCAFGEYYLIALSKKKNYNYDGGEPAKIRVQILIITPCHFIPTQLAATSSPIIIDRTI